MKKVVIMGASTGIGYAVAEALASRGVKVGVAARHTSSLKALKEKYPDFVEYQNVDVTKHDAKGSRLWRNSGVWTYISMWQA